MGKPIQEARAELEKCIHLAKVFGHKAAEWLGPEELKADGCKHQLQYHPLGVILGIMPWNFPFWQLLRFGIPAFLAGNAVVIKPSLSTVACGERIQKLLEEAGLTKGLWQNLLVEDHEIAKLIAHVHIKGVSLTGSTRAGKSVAAVAGAHLKKAVLELGGNDPFIVFDDADLNLAVSHALKSRFLNAGQSCIAAKKIYVEKNLYPIFLAKFIAEIKKIKIDDPLLSATEMGPMVSLLAKENLQRQVQDAVDKGAKILYQSEAPSALGFFFPPMVLTNVLPSMRMAQEEVFGPVAVISSFENWPNLVSAINQSPYGLGASIWTKNLPLGEEILAKLESGTGFINHMTKSDPLIPFGGFKDSGLGKELGALGLREFTQQKVINVYRNK
jgi:succinate-semialdehyde dehydrogenase/glutarate-semialdehyde dehydrogenase